ncbi:hypothetical protein KIN20_002086 [Parelaphostrongylus tenuis]|uniref:Apple domain-containing protein n=1 Tax=Parelaphostrongylus tenuis TaxID=148309 RepID=A0AAD5MDR5_PARTN|nr:hypothetical protein KIN20_002086 [Parelaphostrongylus tenuis]
MRECSGSLPKGFVCKFNEIRSTRCAKDSGMLEAAKSSKRHPSKCYYYYWFYNYHYLASAKQESCDTRTFAFEKFAHLEAIDEVVILDSSVEETLEKCLEKCLERVGCRAAQYSHRNGSCLLLKASPNTVYNLRKSFTYSNDVNLYENNCIEGNK